MDIIKKILLLFCIIEYTLAGVLSITQKVDFGSLSTKGCSHTSGPPLVLTSGNASHGAMCTAIFREVTEETDYQFNVSLRAQTNNGGWPGVIFNAVDEDNFDYITVSAPIPGQIDSCFWTGYMENGNMKGGRNHPCQSKHISYAFWAGISIRVTPESTFLNLGSPFKSKQGFTIESHFPPRARIGLLVKNRERNTITLLHMEIFITYQPHSLHNSTTDREEKQKLQLYPRIGPLAGGTEITISGVQIHNDESVGNITVKLGSLRCETKLISVTNSSVVAITPPFPLETGDDEEVPLIVTLYAGTGRLIAALDQRFTYRPNPVILDFYPKDTIVAGGSTINVTGDHLTSVETHVMVVEMIHERGEDNDIISQYRFQSECHVLSDVIMTCQTPALVIPPLFGGFNSSTPGAADRNKQRYKRAAESLFISSVGNDRLMFYISFKSDGVVSLTERSEKTMIVVYANPSFLQFPGNPPRMLYNSHMDHWLRLQGQHLRQGIRAGDYTVIIGMSRCTRIEVTDNLLVCQPPGTQPMANGTLDIKGIPHVQVLAGYSNHFIGHLAYVSHNRATSESSKASPCNVADLFFWFCMIALVLTEC